MWAVAARSKALSGWDCWFEFRRGTRMFLSCECCVLIRSLLRRADHSSRGVVSRMVCMRVISKVQPTRSCQTMKITEYDNQFRGSVVVNAALLVGRSRDRSPVVSLGIFFFGSIRQVHVPGVDSASKNECQDIPGGKGGRCVGVTTLPSSCAECHEIWEP